MQKLITHSKLTEIFKYTPQLRKKISMKLETKLCSSLYKVMPATVPEGKNFSSGCALRKEIYAFQLAYCPMDFHRCILNIDIESPLKPHISCRSVELIPVDYTGLIFDDDYLSTAPGVFPDRLKDISSEPVKPSQGQWRSLWFKVDVPENCPAGKYPIRITISAKDDAVKKRVAATRTFTLEVLPLTLPEQTLDFTNWFHADCIATYYNCEIFSEEHWHILENFFKCAACHGMNLLLTPLFTPPLDTAVGAERPTCQLVGVKYNSGKYSFDFTRLDRWITLAQKCGIKKFEMSHLFTQWGAEFTPKIVAEVNGTEKRIFGWDIRADSKEYEDFLRAFLPELTTHLDNLGLHDKVFFHCSDEPNEKHLASYRYASGLLKKYLKDFPVIDALSSVEFYRRGYIANPIPCISHFDHFAKENIPGLWTYYCCAPAHIYPNRFITMPSSRNRVLGALLYYHDIKGFLHWGFNFYYAQLSTHAIDPYRTTDSDGAFPGGDAFIVYPEKNGIPEDSIRHEVFFEALQDQRALQLLETFVSRKQIMKMLDKFAAGKILTMADYPKGENNVLAVRKKINAMLKKYTPEV